MDLSHSELLKASRDGTLAAGMVGLFPHGCPGLGEGLRSGSVSLIPVLRMEPTPQPPVVPVGRDPRCLSPSCPGGLRILIRRAIFTQRVH